MITVRVRPQQSRSVRCSADVDAAEPRLRQAPASPWPPAVPSTRSGKNGATAPVSDAACDLRRVQAARTTLGGVCRVCRGRRVIPTPGGPRPCTACVGWRASAHYQPGRKLVRIEDINLKVLDPPSVPTPAADEPAAEEQQQQQQQQEQEQEQPQQQQQEQEQEQEHKGMSEAKRQAIKQAMRKRGPLQVDHKRSIARAMRAAHAADQSIRMTGRPKRCGHCGQEGHNRKRCPQLFPDAKPVAEEKAIKAAAGGKARPRIGPYSCSFCGETGHNRRLCPKLTGAQGQGQAGSPSTDDESLSSQQAEAAGASWFTINKSSEEEKQQDNDDSEVSAADSKEPKQDAAAAAASIEQPSQENAGAARQPDDPVFTGEASAAVSGPEALALLKRSFFLGAGASVSPDGGIVFPLPMRREQCVAQAAGAALRAWEDGVRRQTLELLLPQSNATADGGWPGGIRQQFRVALPMVEELLLKLKQAEGLEGRITAEWLDEGDCVGAWQSERLAAVLFPSADALPAVQRIDDALSGKRLTLLLNPQWQPAGQVVSDFGFGRSRRAAERYIDSLEETYYLKRVRVLGDELRVLRCYPGQWQVHYIPPGGGTAVLLAAEEAKPTYQRLLELIKGVGGSRASKSWLDRALTPGSYDEFSTYDEDDGAAGAAAAAAAAAEEEEGVERDIVTGEVVRDYRMQPVQQMAKWLGREGGAAGGGERAGRGR